jgi:protein involved in polysaccharide export with SLBB domain
LKAIRVCLCGTRNFLTALCSVLLLSSAVHAQTESAAPAGEAPAGSVAAATAAPLSNSAVSIQAFHQLLPNDYIRVVLSVDQTFSYDRTVDAAGNITLPYVDAVHVEGLTVSGIEQLLQQEYREYYVSPNVDVALLALGQSEVLLVLPTGRSTLRTVRNGDTVYDLLASLFPTELRYRYAYVIRGGYEYFRTVTRQSRVVLEAPALPPAEASGSGTLQLDTGMGAREQLRLETLLDNPNVQSFRIDIAQLLRAGRLEENLELRAGDIIFVTYGDAGRGVVGRGPKLVQLVTSDQNASAENPTLGTTYGLLPGESLADLLRIAGYEESPHLDLRNVLIESHDADGRLKRIVANLDPASSSLNLERVQLAHRDTVRIVPYLDQVFVVGSVQTAGALSYNPTYKVLDYIAQAGGASGDAHLRFVKVLRQGRTVGADITETQAFNVDLGQDLKGQAAAGYSIIPGDIIFVPSKGYEPSIRDVTSAMSSLFLGINFFEDLVGGNDPGSGS